VRRRRRRMNPWLSRSEDTAFITGFWTGVILAVLVEVIVYLITIALWG
jgi:hypothetical protein